jgi:hypothetical protein
MACQTLPAVYVSQALTRIDCAYRRGQLALGERHFYRVAAVKAPHLLPPALQPTADQSISSPADPTLRQGRFSATAVLIEAFQALPNLDAPLRAEIEALMAPPDDFDYYLQAEQPFPVRVNYSDPAQETLAQVTLDAINETYAIEVDEWGFWAPPIEPGTDYYRFFITDLSQGWGGYTLPYAENPATAHRDAFSYIVLNERVGVQGMLGLVAHEFNHACQASMDVYELVAFMENTAAYLETRVDYMSWVGNIGMIYVYQKNAHRPLEYMNMNMTDGYEYGGSLWTSFLNARYGGYDPAWIRQIWEGSVQTGYGNEPDYFDVLDEMLAESGGFREMVKTFARDRFFVGRDDDGQHIEHASRYLYGEVARIAELRTDDLPVRDASPLAEKLPQPNGCNYITVDVADALENPVRFSIQADPQRDWYITVMRVADKQDTAHTDMTLDANGHGELTIHTGPLDRLVLAVCQLGGPDYDPDDYDFTDEETFRGTYTYSIETVYPAPQITSLDPDTFVRGTQGKTLDIYGNGFVDSAELTLEASGELISLQFARFVSPQHLRATVTVSADAEKGTRDLTVINPGGNTATLPGALNIVDADETGDGSTADSSPLAAKDSAKGCQCRLGGSHPAKTPAPPYGLLALLFLMCCVLDRNRRRAG